MFTNALLILKKSPYMYFLTICVTNVTIRRTTYFIFLPFTKFSLPLLQHVITTSLIVPKM